MQATLKTTIALSLLLAAAAGAQAATRANDVPGNLVTNGSMDYNGKSAGGPGNGNGEPGPDDWTEFKGTPIGSHWYDPSNMAINQNYYAGAPGANSNIGSSPEGPNSYGAQIYRGGEYRYYRNYEHGLQQTITGLVPGHTYELSFYAAASSYYSYGTANWKVSFMGQSYTTPAIQPGVDDDRTCYGYFGNGTTQCYGGTGPNGSGRSIQGIWNQYKTTFTANADSSVLSFAAAMPFVDASPFTYGIQLDGVVLIDTTPVPEPATVALLMAGLGGLLVWRRRGARRPG